MNNSLKNWWSKSSATGTILFVVLMGFCIWMKHTELVKKIHTNQMIDAWGDGLKTYTNAIYHIDHDSTYHWFGGMNYPYGEHIVPATELPGVAILMKALKGWIPTISDYVVSVIHLEMLLALFFCGLFIYLIFREIDLPVWYSIVVAIGISFLSPQNIRMASHYGLAQQFVVPMLFYFMLLYEKEPNWKYSFWIAFGIFISSFLHFYFFAITVFFVSGHLFFKVIFSFSKEKLLAILPHYFVMCFVPLIFFWFWMLGGDPVTDRSPHPYGFFEYNAIWESVFINRELSYYNWIDEYIIRIERGGMEGTAYIGLPAAVFFLMVLMKGIKGKFRRLIFPFIKENRLFFKSIFWSALILLFFSFAWPFTFLGIESWVDHLGPVRQFRSLGRFAWIFYYVINILAFWGIYHVFKNQKNVALKWSFLMSIFAVFSYEIWHFNQSINLRLHTVSYFNRGEKFTAIDSIDFSSYQTILPIPYFNVGSNNFERGINGFISQKSYTLAIQTGIPNVGSMLTRSSRGQTFNQWQMLLEPYRVPVIFEEYNNDKPLLLLWFKKIKPHEKVQFGHLLEGADLIYEKESLQLYETTKQDFSDRIENEKLAIKAALQTDLFAHQNLLTTDSIENFIYQNFDDLNTQKTYFGNGSFKGVLEDKNEILNQSIPNAQKDSLYHFQTWVWVDSDRFSSTRFELNEIGVDGDLLQQKRFHVWPNVRTFDPNGWILLDMPFRLKSAESKITINFQKEALGDQEIWIDELLIRPSNTVLYQKGENWIWKNNMNYLD